MQGFCNGMMVEGGGRWGYDDIWIKLKKDEEPAPEPVAEDKVAPDNEAPAKEENPAENLENISQVASQN